MGSHLSSPSCSMVESGWLTLDVMQEHLENLISQGYMTAEELATYLMPLGPTFLSQVGGGDTSWHAQHSTSEDLVCHRIDFCAPCCGPIAWSCIT
jgi:hypothetical protein